MRLTLGIFTSWSCNDGKEMVKNRDASAKLLLYQSNPITFFSIFVAVSSSSLLNSRIVFTGRHRVSIIGHGARTRFYWYASGRARNSGNNSL